GSATSSPRGASSGSVEPPRPRSTWCSKRDRENRAAEDDAAGYAARGVLMFSRPLLTYGSDTDPTAALSLLRAMAPGATRLRILLSVPATGRVSLSDSDLRTLESELSVGDEAIAALHRACASDGLEVEGDVVVDPLPEALAG